MVIVSSSVKNLQKGAKKKVKGGGSNPVAATAPGNSKSKGSVKTGTKNAGIGKFPPRPIPRPIAIGSPAVVGAGREKVKTTRNNTLPLPSPKSSLLNSNGPRAQRKFAQGVGTTFTTSAGGTTAAAPITSNLQLARNNPAVTPTKETTTVTAKVSKRVLTPISPPLKRPKTVDFLTFLCFRGTPSLPPQLDYFSFPQPLQAEQIQVQTKKLKAVVDGLGCNADNSQNALPPRHPPISDTGGATFVASKRPSKLVKRANGSSLVAVGVGILKKKINGVHNNGLSITAIAKKTTSISSPSQKKILPGKDKASDNETSPTQTFPSASRINEQDAKFAMTALKLKYQEKRLANQRPAKSLIKMLTKKVKERSMVLTRSRAKTAVGPLKTGTIQRKPNKPVIKPPTPKPLPRNAPSPDIILGVAQSPVKPVEKQPSSGSDAEDSGSDSSKKSSSSGKSSRSSSSSSESEEEANKERATRSLRSGKEVTVTSSNPSKSTKPGQKNISPRHSKKMGVSGSSSSRRVGTRASHRQSKSPLRELPMWNVNVKKQKILAKYKNANIKAKAIAKKAAAGKGSSSSSQSPVKGHITRSALRKLSNVNKKEKEIGRPSRKTKETAAFYLGLINKGFSSDDEQSNEESDKDEKGSSSGDTSSSESKFLEKQYNASLKRTTNTTTSSASSCTSGKKKREKSRSASPASTRKDKSKKDTDAKSDKQNKTVSDSKNEKPKPLPRVLRSQSGGSVDSGRSKTDSQAERRKLLMMTCGKDTAGAARKSAKIISRGRRGSRQYSSSEEEEDEQESVISDMDVEVEDDDDRKETDVEASTSEEEDEKRITRSRSVTNSPMSIPSSRGSKAKLRRVAELIEEEKSGKREKRTSSVSSSRSTARSTPVDMKSVKSDGGKPTPGGKKKQSEIEESESDEEEEASEYDSEVEDPIPEVIKSEEEDMEEDTEEIEEAQNVACSPLPNLQNNSDGDTTGSESEEESDVEEDEDEEDADRPEPPQMTTIGIQVDMDLEEEEETRRKEEEEKARKSREEEAEVSTALGGNSNSIPDSPDPPTPEDSEETCQSARTKGITLPLSDQQKAQLQEAQEEDDEIQEIGQVINNPRSINHHPRPRRSSPSPPIIPIEPDAPRITHIHPTPPHPQPQQPHQHIPHQHIPHSQPQHIPPLTIPHPMPPLTSRTSSLTYTSHQINMGASSVPFVPYSTRPSDFFAAPAMHFGPTAHLVNSVHLVGSSTNGMDFTSELNSPLSTLSIPVSSFPNPLLPHHPNICLGPGGAATMTATSLQTHIRTVATNLDIPLVRPVMGTTTDTSLSFSAMGMSGASHLGGIPLIGHPPPPHNLLTRPPLSSWAQTAAAAAHAHVQAAHAAAAASEARNHYSAFRLPTMTPTSSVPSQMGTHQEPLLRPPVTSALPVSIVQPRGHHHHHHHRNNIPTQNHREGHHQEQGGHHHHHHHHPSTTSSMSTAAPSTSYGYNPESIIRNLPNVSIVPKFDRSSVKTQLPSQNPQSSSKSKHAGSSNSGGGKSEERRPGKKRNKPSTLPAPPSPLTVRKDSVNPATYVGLSSKLKKKLDLNDKPKDTSEQSSSKDMPSSISSSSTIKFDKHLVVKQERPDPDMPPTTSSAGVPKSSSSSNCWTRKDNERSSPAMTIRPEQIKQEVVMSSSAACSSSTRKSHSPCITSIHRMTPDRPSSSSSANSYSAKHPNLHTDDGTVKKRKGGSGKKSHSQSSESSIPAVTLNGKSSYNSKLMEAPTYHPTEQEFEDPLKYFDKIQPEAERFGMARIVPPRSFRPECNVNDDMRFTAYNHYIHKMFKRWGPTVKETEAIKEHLRRTDMDVSTVPVIGGIEIDFSTLHQVVQSLGGLKEVIEEEKWADVADRMHIPKGTHDRATKLDSVYVKYILPYAMLSDDERVNLKGQVEEMWVTRQQKLKERTESSSEDETSDEDSMDDLDDCVIKGKGTPLSAYYRTARNTVGMIFPNGKEPPINELEEEYWKIVRDGVKHLCVYSGSIDCAGVGWGFPAPKASSKHPWNLKVLANNQGSVLRSMGPVMGATVPTLHVSMLFTSYCWYRDPHGLPWVEYLHSGASKIWYSVAAANEPVLRKALMKLMPLQCKNKKLWLPSDSAMVPPELLIENDVPLVRAVQNPGEFLVVFPKSYTSAICAGYLVSESVCFAPPVWLRSCMEIFKDIRDSKEPPVFPIEKLLLSIIRDNKASSIVIKMAAPLAEKVITEELALRKKLSSMGVSLGGKPTSKNNSGKGVSKKKKTPAAEEESEQCYFCNYILHMSLVRNDRTDFVTCLNHAIQHLSRHKAQIKKCTMLCEDTQEELEALLQTAKRRANS